jgi:amino acid adenylation domain-containing protein
VSTHFRPPTETAINRIHRFVEAQAERTPDACAVAYDGQSWTYRAFNRRANQFACHLQSLGVRPETVVGVCLDRSVGAVLSLLAVLKAGGAYLPLDPAYPAERLAYMLADARASLLVTEPDTWPHAAPPGCPTLSYQAWDAATPADDDDGPPVETAAPDADPLAYIIYTSGSTGRPKGVAVPHDPPCHLLRWHARALPLAAGARVLQFAPLSFDASFQEVFGTWAAGGTLVLLDECQRRDPRGLRRFLADERINRVYMTPVMLYQLAELSGLPLPDLTDFIAAGEQLRITPAVVRFFAQHPGARLHNQYGPTETTVITTSHTMTGPPENWPALPPIGRTLDHVKTWLLDDAGRPVPAGQPGELYFGGPCVSRGYLHDAELTRSRFLPDPDDPAARIYRSGDLAQQLPDGAWHYLGRADGQVKIRGFRVELGEIETVLAQHPAIEQAAVAASEPTARGDRELLAGYLLRASIPAPTASELRGWLNARLPDYFVPARLTALPSLPLTPSGKVDRRALATACCAEPATEKELPPAALPGTPAEIAIAGVWREVLNRSRIGLDDNFFEAGGNSIAAARAHAQICDALHVDFPITTFFQHPTIRALAVRVSGEASGGLKLSDAQERARRQRQSFVRPPARPVIKR